MNSDKRLNNYKVFYEVVQPSTRSTPILRFFNEVGTVLYDYSGGMPPTAKNLGAFNKESSQDFAKKNGISASNLCRIITAVVIQEVKQKNPEWAKLCAGRQWMPAMHYWNVLEHEGLFFQQRKDGIANIIPILALTEESPQEARKRYGKVLWRELTRNSYSRNKKIFEILYPISRTSSFYADFKGLMERVNTYPSSLLGKDELFWIDFKNILPFKRLQVIQKHLGIKYLKNLNGAEVFRAKATILDTVRMLGLDAVDAPDWSYRRYLEEHDKAQQVMKDRELQERIEKDKKYLNLEFKTLHNFYEEVKFPSGIVATPMKDIFAVRDEGEKMHHCVGWAYAEMCAEGDYAVWHLTKVEVQATLGIRVRERRGAGGDYVFSQMYGTWNSIIEDLDFKKAAEEIVAWMNKAATIQLETEDQEMQLEAA